MFGELQREIAIYDDSLLNKRSVLELREKGLVYRGEFTAYIPSTHIKRVEKLAALPLARAKVKLLAYDLVGERVELELVVHESDFALLKSFER